MNYFNKLDIIDISTIISESITFYAHLNEKEKEELKGHTNLVNTYFSKIVESKGIESIVKTFEEETLNGLSIDGKKVFRKLFINIYNFHDIGKINPKFQENKMKNRIGFSGKFINLRSKHSIISSILYIDYFIEDVLSLDEVSKYIMLKILFLNAYIISKHHGSLDNFEEFLDRFYVGSSSEIDECINIFKKEDIGLYKRKLKISYRYLEKCVKTIKNNLHSEDNNDSIDIYIYTKLAFSLLVASDFYATSEFMKGVTIEEFGEIHNIEEFYKDYKNTEVLKSIRKYEVQEYKKEKDLLRENNINILRTEMFLDCEGELINNIDNDIFFLEAPTGSGKSNVSLNLSFKLFEERNSLRKIYYVYPFNTLVEQNIKNLKKVFGENREVFNKIAVINSITPIKNEDKEIDDKNEDGRLDYYTKALLNRQFLNYPMILTTHVSIFNTMFNSSKESTFAFHQLANSVIVLDEIQSYKNILWSEIITFLKRFSKIMNIKVIIMSATLPNLNYLTNSSRDTCNLIKDREKYFSNPLFKERVKIDYELIGEGVDELYEHVINNSRKGKRILIEFIKKQTAYDFYNRLKECDSLSSKIELMTGDDNVAERERILKSVEENQDLILVATQVIEAGVDIDMDMGYKDISRLDSDEQFMGRINRSCKKSGMVYFFNLDETSGIYKDDVRVNKDYSLLNTDMREILINKNFEKYYELVLKDIKGKYNDSSSDSNLNDFFINYVGKLNFPMVEKRMELINDDMWSLSVFLARTIELENNVVLDGSKVWEDYKNILMDTKMEYAEKEVRLSIIRSFLNYFIYQVKKSDLLYNDRLGELYYIEDGEKYFKDGKVDKEKLTTGIGDFI